MQVWSKLKRRWRSRTYRRVTVIRLLLTIFAGFGISLVLVSGPYIQSAFTSFMSGDKPSLYEGMYATGIGGFPSVSAYVRAAFWLPYLICGMSIAAAIAWLNSKRLFLAGVSLVAAAGLTVIDVMHGTAIHELIVSVACNIVGGIVLAFFSLIVAANASVIHFISDGNKYIERIVWALYPAACFFALAGVLFFILAFIIKIPSASVSIRLAPPMSGYVSSDNPSQCNCHGSKIRKNKKDDKFGVLSKFSPLNGSEKKWVGFGKKLSIGWKKKNSARVSAEFRVVEGCATRRQLKRMLKAPPFEKDATIGDRHIDVDNGLSQFQIISDDYVGRIELSDRDSSISQFWITPATNNSSKVSVSRFVYDGSLHINDAFQPLSYEIGLSPYGEKNGSLKSRRIRLVANDFHKSEFIDIQFDPSSIDLNSTMECKELKLTPVNGGYTAVATMPIVSLIVSVDHAKDISYKDFENPDVLKVNGISGWITTDGFKKSRIDTAIKTGKIGMMSVFGAISDVQVNDEDVATGPTSTLRITGTLYGRSDGPTIMIAGYADYMSLNGHRMTLTRWESLDTAIRVPIILGVPTVLYILLRMLSEVLSRPMRHVWYLPR